RYGPFPISTRRAGGELLDMGLAVSLHIGPGTLHNPTCAFETTAPGATGGATIQFTTTNPLPADGRVEIQFPGHSMGSYVLSNAALVAQSGLDGTLQLT